MKAIQFKALILIIAALTIPAWNKSADGKCRALAMRGGGSKGAYEVGVLKGLVKYLEAKEREYDVVVGVSVGALNAAILAVHDIGNETAAVDQLERLYT